MSDIKLLLNSYEDMDQDDDYNKYYESSMLDQTNPDDLLSPLEKLRKYCTSENIFTRQMVARSIIETVQSIQNAQECLSLLEVITKLSNDIEPSVRNELMEQLPPCSLMIMDMRLVPNAIADYILPVMVKYLTDSNNQVRKLTQNALLQLIDQEMITRIEVERQICPVLLTLTEPDSGDDFRTEAVGLMTKITPLIGSENAQHSFLRRFGDLCADPLFHVRKVCASNFGDMCSVLTQDTTEQQLLPLFARLCEDGVWGVRKACAETFIAVSGSCSRQVRYDRLSPLFVGLLCDKSRWVQMAAYTSLGQFISTFAEPERSGFDIDENGSLVRCPKTVLNTTTTISTAIDSVDGRDSPSLPELEDPSSESDRLITSSVETTPSASSQNTTINHSVANDKKEEENTFNNFEYWRTPIPNFEIPDDLTVNNSTPETPENSTETENPSADTTTTTNEEPEAESQIMTDSSTDENKESAEALEEQRADAVSPRPSVDTSHVDDFMHLDPTGHGFHSDSDEDDSNLSMQQNTSNYASSIVDEESLHSQTVVPPALLEHYISMTEASKVQTIDAELPRHCAYTLPGVVLALGADHWPLLKDTYELLSTDMQWKVRRSLAFSIHDLALILGEEICVADLVSVFNGFLKDLDEVRIGVLKHLYDFISLLPSELQKEYLQIFSEFRITDNMRNWRFREDLAQQLMNLSHLYTYQELADHICPVALELACDNVAEVRQNSFHLISILIRRIAEEESNVEILGKFVASITVLGAPTQHWVKRKACSQIYQHFVEGQWYDGARFAEHFLPNLISLCKDTVPNIRFIAAKALIAFMKTEHFQSLPEDDEVRKSVDHTLESLQQDDDRDVRFFSGGKVKEYNFSVSDNESEGSAVLDSFEGMLHRQGGGITTEDRYLQKITRGINEYTISSVGDDDDEDDDSDLVEEVYMEEHGLGDDDVIEMQPGDVIIEEYYTEDGRPVSGSMAGATTQYVVEEIVEEVITTIGQPKTSNPEETGNTESGKSSEETSSETGDATSSQ